MHTKKNTMHAQRTKKTQCMHNAHNAKKNTMHTKKTQCMHNAQKNTMHAQRTQKNTMHAQRTQKKQCMHNAHTKNPQCMHNAHQKKHNACTMHTKKQCTRTMHKKNTMHAQRTQKKHNACTMHWETIHCCHYVLHLIQTGRCHTCGVGAALLLVWYASVQVCKCASMQVCK